MSSPKLAATKAPRRAKVVDPAAKTRAAAKPLKVAAGMAVPHRVEARPGVAKKATATRQLVQRLAVNATELAGEIEQGLAEGRLDILPPQALQALMAALCKTYAANLEAGHAFQLLSDRSAVTSTDVMVTCGALLKSADLQVFELGMWQSWTGR